MEWRSYPIWWATLLILADLTCWRILNQKIRQWWIRLGMSPNFFTFILNFFMIYIWYGLYKFRLWHFFGFHMFDSFVNRGRMVIEQAFGTWKNGWRILKTFNMYVKKTTLVTLAYCVLHNYCEIHNQPVHIHADVGLRRDPHVGFCMGMMQLLYEDVAANVAGLRMKNVLFLSWLECNPEWCFSKLGFLM